MKQEDLDKLDMSGTNTEPAKFPSGEVPLAKYNLYIDSAERDEDGFWTVIRKVKHTVTFDGNLFFIREKAVKSLDKDFDRAVKTTNKAMNAAIDEYEGDFWSKPEWEDMQYIMRTDDTNLVQAEKHHGIIEDVTNTKA